MIIRRPLQVLIILIGLLLPVLCSGQQETMSQGFALLRARQYRAAADVFTRIIEMDPENADAYNHRGVARAYMGKMDAAISDYTRALKIEPELVGALNNRGSAYYQKRQLNLAISDYSKAIEINPYLAEGYSNRGTAWAAKGDYFRAIRDYTQALEANPYFDAPYYNRGRALSTIGDYPQAIGDLERVIALNPKFHDAYHLLATIFAKCPDPKYRNGQKAVVLAKKAVELNSNPEYLSTLADAYTEAGRFDLAIVTQQQAMGMYREQGKTDRAADSRKRLEAIVEKKRQVSRHVQTEKRADALPKKTAAEKTYTVQAGAFLSKENADFRRAVLTKKGYPAKIVRFTDRKKRVWHTVRVGSYEKLNAARDAAKKLAEKEKVRTSVRPGGSL